MKICIDCPHAFVPKRRHSVRCPACVRRKELEGHQRRNARKPYRVSKDRDMPGDVIEAQIEAELARIRWERARQSA